MYEVLIEVVNKERSYSIRFRHKGTDLQRFTNFGLIMYVFIHLSNPYWLARNRHFFYDIITSYPSSSSCNSVDT